MELFDYQKKAVDFITDKKRVYLALDMGLGKTITSLASADKSANKNVMLVAEKNEIVNSENFRREVINNFPDFQYISLRDEDLSFIQGSNTRTVCGINPDGLAKYDHKKLLSIVDSMIIDEATLAKTTTTDRFKRVHKIAKGVEYLTLLSGTPMMNGASELYAPLILLDHAMVSGKGAEGRKAFEKVFAGGHYQQIRSIKGVHECIVRKNWFKYYAWWAKGAENIRVLRWLIRDSFFFMLKGETNVFKKKVRTIERVLMSLEWIAEYTRAWDNYLIEAKARAVDMDNVQDLRSLIENGQMYQVNSRWKAKRVVEDIVSGKYKDQRIIVWTMFIETYGLIQEELNKHRVSFKTFDELKEWKEGTEQVLVGRIKAHGKGGNVPQASVCLFVDMDFVPANNIQAENRVDRPEQTRDMTIVYYITEGEDVVDNYVRKINKVKIKRINEFMKPLSVEELDNMPVMIDELRAKFTKECEILGI